MWQRALDTNSTIFAKLSGSLPSAVAITRLSGPRAFPIAEQIFKKGDGNPLSRQRGMHLGTLHRSGGETIDHPLVLCFVAPDSYTGEDTLEFQCHGSVAVQNALESELVRLGAIPASRGEFSYRAFLNGKMSSDELELLGDIFRARQSWELSALFGRRSGQMASFIEELRKRLLSVQAILETAVDFSDEYSNVITQAKSPLSLAIQACDLAIQRADEFYGGTQLPRVVIAGSPNAGKSSLFNALLSLERAIVHSEAGTTRDVVEEGLEIGGRVVRLVDTAGVREAESEPERIGVELGQKFLENCECWILVVDGTQGLGSSDTKLLERCGNIPHAIVWNKKDHSEFKLPGGIHDAFSVSALTGEGVDAIRDFLRDSLSQVDDNSPLPSRQQLGQLKSCKEQLIAIVSDLGVLPPEFSAERLRHLIGSVESIVGPVDTDQVLTTMFNEFCIGK